MTLAAPHPHTHPHPLLILKSHPRPQPIPCPASLNLLSNPALLAHPYTGPPIIGSGPEDRERAAAVRQAESGSAVLPLANYLMFTSAPPITRYVLRDRSALKP